MRWEEYLTGLKMVTQFQDKVYSLCKKVPKGKVTTYKELAKAMKSRAYRAVGSALNKNPFAPEVPCHRVIGSDGKMVGFASGVDKKIAILRKEGVEVIDGKVDLGKYMFRF